MVRTCDGYTHSHANRVDTGRLIGPQIAPGRCFVVGGSASETAQGGAAHSTHHSPPGAVCLDGAQVTDPLCVTNKSQLIHWVRDAAGRDQSRSSPRTAAEISLAKNKKRY